MPQVFGDAAIGIVCMYRAVLLCGSFACSAPAPSTMDLTVNSQAFYSDGTHSKGMCVSYMARPCRIMGIYHSDQLH